MLVQAKVIADAPILIPNKEHKNFTESAESIPDGTVVNGFIRNIDGLRKGKPFVYKVFYTTENQLIYLNKIKPIKMDNAEVTLGADGASATKVNIAVAEKSTKHKWYGAVIGGVAGFAYCKHKKHDLKKSAMFIALGAIAGFGVGYYMDNGKHSIQITPSK